MRWLQILGWSAATLGTWLGSLLLFGYMATAGQQVALFSPVLTVLAVVLLVVGGALLALAIRSNPPENLLDPRRPIRVVGMALVGIGAAFSGYVVVFLTAVSTGKGAGIDGDGLMLIVLVTAVFTASGVVLILAARLLTTLNPLGLLSPWSSVGDRETRSRLCELRSSDGTLLTFTEVGVFAVDGRLDHMYRTQGAVAGQPITDTQLAQLIR